MTRKKALTLDRLIEVAGEEFSRRRFEDVSVGEIAQRAHCSTSTIYEVYGSKVDLFRSAMLHRLALSWAGQPDTESKPALLGLLCYFDKRMRALASKESRDISRAVFEQNAIVGASVAPQLFNQRTTQREIVYDQVSRAIAEGSMKDLPLDVISYLLSALCSYEAVLCGMTFGPDYTFDFNEVTRKTFLLFVTEEGSAILNEFLAEN